MKKITPLLIIILFITSPLVINADGGVIRPLPDGDWVWVEENSQQAFINYEEETEKLIIAVNIEESSSDVFWIIPIPSKPENIEIDITSKLPVFFGDEVMSKAKINFSENLRNSYLASLFGQIWTFPFTVMFVSLGGARGGASYEMIPGDMVSIETHIEKAGMIAEVITARDGRAIYDYFSKKSFDIKEGSIKELDAYIEKDYSFVVSWITNEEIRGQRGIFIEFPISKIYYPLILTSVYGELEIPITIRVLGHVKPEIFPEIKDYTKVDYFTERTKKVGGQGMCLAKMSQLRAIMEIYYSNHNSYPSSLRSLENDELLGNDIKDLLKDINKYCYFSPLYTSKSKDDYMITVMTDQGWWVIDSSLFSGLIDKKRIEERALFSPELEKFYGTKKPWEGKTEYTRITINAPSKLFHDDLWMEDGRPLKISFALWGINNPLIVAVILYLLIVGAISFVAGGIAGLLCFRKFKKYALIGFSNIFTLIGLILTFNYLKKKREEDIKHERIGFEFLFSLIFVFLLIFFLLAFLLWTEGEKVWFLPFMAIIGIILIIGSLLLIDFFLSKIKLKNRIIRVIATIILSVIFWISIGLLFFLLF